jgi:chromosome segregation ATPase
MGILKKMSGLSTQAINRGLMETVIKPGGVVEFLGEQVDGGGTLCGPSVQARILAACAKEFDAVTAEVVPWAQEKKLILEKYEAAGRKLADANRQNAALLESLKDKEVAFRRLESRQEGLRLNNKGLQAENAMLLRRENRSLRDALDDLKCQLDGCDQGSILQADLQRAKNEIDVLRMQVAAAKGKDSDLRQATNAPQEKSEAAGRPAAGRPAYVGVLDSFLKHATRPVDAEAERAEAKLIEDLAAMAKEFAEANDLDFHVQVIKL